MSAVLVQVLVQVPVQDHVELVAVIRQMAHLVAVEILVAPVVVVVVYRVLIHAIMDAE